MTMTFEFNVDHDRRDQILDPYFEIYHQRLMEAGFLSSPARYGGGIQHFQGLTLDALTSLFNEYHIDPDDVQNFAPSAGEIYDFVVRHPNFTVHGYAVSPTREDYRVSIEGVECHNPTHEDRVDFLEMFRDADELSNRVDYLRCWYD